jgi:hypothetical protein
MLRVAGRGFFVRRGRASAGTVGTNGQLPIAQPGHSLRPVRTDPRYVSDHGTATWKKEAPFFFPSSTAIYLNKHKAIQLSGKAFRLRIAPNKKCILLYDDSDGVPGTQQLQVYDPVAKHEIAWGVDKDGQRQIQKIMIDGMRKGMKAAKGVGGSWELKVFTNDGKTITTTCKWSFAQLDETHSTMVWTDVKEDGNPKPDTKLVLERQPERTRRTKQ